MTKFVQSCEGCLYHLLTTKKRSNFVMASSTWPSSDKSHYGIFPGAFLLGDRGALFTFCHGTTFSGWPRCVRYDEDYDYEGCSYFLANIKKVLRYLSWRAQRGHPVKKTLGIEFSELMTINDGS